MSSPKLTTMRNKMADETGLKLEGFLFVVLTYCANLAVCGIQVQILQFYQVGLLYARHFSNSGSDIAFAIKPYIVVRQSRFDLLSLTILLPYFHERLIS